LLLLSLLFVCLFLLLLLLLFLFLFLQRLLTRAGLLAFCWHLPPPET